MLLHSLLFTLLGLQTFSYIEVVETDLQKASVLFKKEGNQEFAQKADSAVQKIQER